MRKIKVPLLSGLLCCSSSLSEDEGLPSTVSTVSLAGAGYCERQHTCKTYEAGPPYISPPERKANERRLYNKKQVPALKYFTLAKVLW